MGGSAGREELRAYLTIGRPLSLLNPISALGVLASGVYLATQAHFWMLSWVQVAVAAWVVNSLVAARIVKPVLQGVAREVAAGATPEPGTRLDALRWSARWTHGGDMLAANDVVVLCLMTVKPGLTGSILVLLAANLAVLGFRVLALARRWSAPRMAGAPGS
jgi:hypothetical protein